MPKGMFVDTTICIGCKACQVACKQWNALSGEPADFRTDPAEKIPVAVNFTGDSYDNALAETVIGLYKTEVIRRKGPWRNLDAVEYATLE